MNYFVLSRYSVILYRKNVTMTSLSQKAIKLSSHPDFIKKISIYLDIDKQTFRKWLKDNSRMLTLYDCYSFIQREFKLSDKELFCSGK